MTSENLGRAELPAAYESKRLDGEQNVLEEAVSLAEKGATEGTLLWATRQRQGSLRPGKPWFSPEQGLYLGLVLEPEFDKTKSGEIGLLGLLSMGQALADFVAPLTDLRYRWPNDLLLSGSKVGGITLRQDDAGRWLVLGASVNVGQEPVEVIDGGCVCIEGGCAELQPAALLESFARYFLHWINRWDEEGLAPVLLALKGRWGNPGDSVLLELPNEKSIAGAFQQIDDSGGLVVEAEEKPVIVSLNEFFELK